MPFISCSSDDDEAVEQTMFGKWQLSATMPVEGQEMTVPLSDCDKKSTIEFGEDGSFTSEEFTSGMANAPQTVLMGKPGKIRATMSTRLLMINRDRWMIIPLR